MNLNAGAPVVLVGDAIPSSYISAEKNEPYFAFKLKTPVLVRCSVNKDIEAFETDEVFVRESSINQDGWVMVDEKKPEEGFYRPDWVVDFSINQQIPIYQPETINNWRKGNRDERKRKNTDSANSKIREMLAKKASGG